jgi:hypothetical protein
VSSDGQASRGGGTSIRGSHYTGSMWQPPTRGSERRAAEDERTSRELAERLNLRSARGLSLPATPRCVLCKGEVETNPRIKARDGMCHRCTLTAYERERRRRRTERERNARKGTRP